ncbi:MAG: iron-containing alcohol dehydrogenase [Cellvibrionaceae bacterium]|nr:iron-containing alcohol dehydrogenase [Cellvibrionaceae bacterium]
MQGFEFSSVAKWVCRLGAAQDLRLYCESCGITTPLLVSDKGLVNAGIVEAVAAPLRRAGLEPRVYSEVVADPPQAQVLSAVKMARAAKVDGIIGLGGGSSLDVAKLIAVLLHSEQSLQDLYGLHKVRGRRSPLILLPTTAGTGSEVTPIAIITTGETTKAAVVATQLLPDLAILDAELTRGLPAAVTAATGIDAMVHAIEAYTSKLKKNPYSDMLATQALRLMSANLLEAVDNGGNMLARENMLLGAMLAGQAFANAPVAAVHALAYPLGGNYHIPHGLSNALVLPHVLRFNAPEAAPLYAQLLPCVQAKAEINAETKSVAARCEAFIDYCANLIAATGLPNCLSQLKVPETDLGRLADEAMAQQRLLVNNPRVVKRADALAIYAAAFN